MIDPIDPIASRQEARIEAYRDLQEARNARAREERQAVEQQAARAEAEAQAERSRQDS